MNSMPNIVYLGTGYFHQDYDLDAPTPSGVIESFRDQDAPELVSGVLVELRRALKELDEPGLRHLWIEEAKSYYEPDQDGLTYREWFEHAVDVLNEPPSEGQ